MAAPSGDVTGTAKRSCGLYQISSSFSETSMIAVADHDPVDAGTSSPRAATRPLVWMRPMT